MKRSARSSLTRCMETFLSLKSGMPSQLAVENFMNGKKSPPTFTSHHSSTDCVNSRSLCRESTLLRWLCRWVVGVGQPTFLRQGPSGTGAPQGGGGLRTGLKRRISTPTVHDVVATE